MLEWYWILLIVVGLIIILASMYRIVRASEAHYVVSMGKSFVCSPDEKIRDHGEVKGSRWYLAIPILRKIRVLDVTIKELVISQETYEKNQARYKVKSSIKYRIKNVRTAADTFIDDENLQEQLKEVVMAGVRAITVKYDVTEARASKKAMDIEIRDEITDDLEKWGLSLENFQLIDFQDTDDSKIVSDISRRREVEIESRTREENAEKKKNARVKEAESEEIAKNREIDKDRSIGQREQDRDKLIAEKRREAEQKRFDVVRVQTVRQAEIDKEKAIVKANQDKDTEKIFMDKKQLEGQGDKLRAMEQAKGEAAPIREKGFAEAEAKEKLQAALNKFKDEAIRALVAEKIVAMQQEVGIKTADALKEADVRVFAGGEGDTKSGFDLGKIISSMQASNEGSAKSVLNRIARPNDLGLMDLDIKGAVDSFKKKGKEATPKTSKK